MIRHHPDDALLMACAAGTLRSGAALLTAVHVESCAQCRRAVRGFERVAATLLMEEDCADLPVGLFDRVTRRIDGPEKPRVLPRVSGRPALPPGLNWPRSMRHCQVSRWHRMGPGVKWSRVRVPDDPDANIVLLRLGAGRCVPPHSHDGLELTQVIHGAFDDGRDVFAAGDFDSTDGSIHHQPVVQASGECICLGAVEGRLVFEGLIARWAGALVGL